MHAKQDLERSNRARECTDYGVSSLWQVPDDETMSFMKRLYSQEAATYPELMQKMALRKINELRLRGRPMHRAGGVHSWLQGIGAANEASPLQ